jgi:putative phage-type endonuclease
VTAVPLGKHEPGTPEWDDARRFRLGGSEIAAVLGLSPWESRLSLWLRKKELLPARAGNPQMEWGRRLEPAIRDKFVEDDPGEWQPNPGMFHHSDRHWQLSSPDALRPYPAADLLEVKWVPHAKPEEWGEPGTDEIPVYYRAQVLQYVDVHDFEAIWLAALLHGSDYRVYRIDRDEVDITLLREYGLEFVTDLINDRPPDIDRHSATYRALRELHPAIQPGAVEIDPGLAGDYLAAVIAHQEAAVDKEYYGSQVLQQLGSLRDAVVDGARFAFRTHRSRNGQPGTPFLATDRKRLEQITYPKTIREALGV